MKKILLLLLLFPLAGFAADASFTVQIREHRFQPAEIRVPAGQKIRLLVENKDATPEEFESHSLNREKVIAGNASAIIRIGPLQPGRYSFFGEFHEDTAQGVLIAE
jgi:plastocyanin